MNQDLKPKVVEALLSGKYMQTSGTLKRETTISGVPEYCCLGVIREIADPNDTDSCDYEGGVLSKKQLRRFELSSEEEDGLIEMNDLCRQNINTDDPEDIYVDCGPVPFDMIAGFIDYWL